MKLNKKFRHFKKWFRDSETHFHQAQSSDENIAESGFDEGFKYANFLNGNTEKRDKKLVCPRCGSDDLFKSLKAELYDCKCCGLRGEI